MTVVNLNVKKVEKYFAGEGYHRKVALVNSILQLLEPKLCENITEYANRALKTLREHEIDFDIEVSINNIILTINKNMTTEDVIFNYRNNK